MLLHSIREKATGWIAWVIVILISIPFALWGINSYITPDANPAVANIGDYKITVQEFQNAVQNESQKLQGQVDNALLKQIVLERLINNRAMINYLADTGLKISKAQIDQLIRNDENFQLDGRFSEDLYNRSLPSVYSKATYRNGIATELLLKQYTDGILQSSIVSEQEVNRIIKLIKQKRDISYVTINADKFKDEVSVSDDEIKTYYQNFQNRFQNPEQVKLAYLEVSRKDIAQSIEVSEKQIEKYYQNNLSEYTQPERRKASHILFTLPTDADDETRAKVSAQAREVLEQIKGGADFAEMAKTYSQDTGSAENGGELGYFGAGEMVPAFEQAAFALKTGEVSDVVESPFGYHIIKVLAIEGGEAKPLAEVKDSIRAAIQFNQAETAYFEQTEAMQTLAYEQPDSLEPVANELGMSIKQSGLISRSGGQGIFANSKLLDAAFGESVLEEGNNSDLIELDDDHVAVIRVIERIPASSKPLEQVKAEIQAQLQSEGLLEKAQAKADELVKALRSGQSMTDLAQENSLTVETTGLVDRQAITVPPAIIKKAFSMPRGEQYATTKTAAGNIAVIAINAVEDGDVDDKELFASIKAALLQNKGNLNTALSVMQIRSESDITINTSLLNEEE